MRGGLLDLPLLLGGSLLLVLRHLREELVAVLSRGLERMGLPAQGLVRKVLLVALAAMGDPNVKPVVLLLRLIDSGDAVIRAWIHHESQRVE